MRRFAVIALILATTWPCFGQQVIIARRRVPHSVGPTITVTSAVCTGTGVANTATCTLTPAVGDLLIIKSKSAGTASGTNTIAVTYGGTAACTATQVIAPVQQTNGGASFVVAESGCIVTAAGAAAPIVTWVGTFIGGTFVDIEAFTVHTTNTWKATFVDQVATNVGATTSTSCPTGTTAATTTATDFIFATCDVFNAAQTWGTLAGFTQYAAASRNTAGAYYKSVSSTGTQTTTVPLSATDFGIGMVAAFASN